MHLLLSEPREGDRLAARVRLFGMPPRNELMRGIFFAGFSNTQGQIRRPDSEE